MLLVKTMLVVMASVPIPIDSDGYEEDQFEGHLDSVVLYFPSSFLDSFLRCFLHLRRTPEDLL